MTRADRERIATPLVLAYWLTLVGGLVLFTTTRSAEGPVVVALWLGALAGTMLGQYLALRDYRLWIVGLVLVICAIYGAPLVPDGAAGRALGQAFIPAALCGFWLLGDRAAIAACWFPAVIWMLSILDHTGSSIAPDGVGASLLAGFAVAFLALLRAREARRVELWQAVGAVALAPTQAAELLREPPGRQLARAGWGLSVAGIAVAITVWIAPRLWHVEVLGGAPVRVADATPGQGRPCCPLDDEADTTRARVQDYLDLGRGHDARAGGPARRAGCRPCPPAVAMTGGGPAVRDPWRDAVVAVDGTPLATDASGGGAVVGVPDGGTTGWRPSPASEGSAIIDGAAAGTTATPPRATDAAPIASAAPGAPPLPTVQPRLDTSAPPAAPPAAPPLPTTERLDEAPRDQAGPPAPPIDRPTPMASPERDGSLVPWLIALATAALLFQVVALALRPVRRLLTLRHLRRPFWTETVDQRVSNAWQLALVGLHDAGWRPGVHEAPQALARRVGVSELERCATILERARHGLGIDAGDLEVMRASADAAYHAARRGLGRFARVVGWIRWPLT